MTTIVYASGRVDFPTLSIFHFCSSLMTVATVSCDEYRHNLPIVLDVFYSKAIHMQRVNIVSAMCRRILR